MARWPIGLLVLVVGCDYVWRIDHFDHTPDASPDGPNDAAIIPRFVQSASTDDTTTSVPALAVAFAQPVVSDDLIVAMVGWTQSSNVTEVTDTVGTSFVAVGPVMRENGLSEVVWYGRSTLSGPDTVTVTFSAPTANTDLRILEYAGIAATDPVDETTAGVGSGVLASSGPVTTSHGIDMLVASAVVGSRAAGPGMYYTQHEITGVTGSLAEDRVVSAAGTYDATAPLEIADYWIIRLVAFKGE